MRARRPGVARQTISLLGRRHKWQVLAVFASTLVMGLISMVGVASIMPFMAVVANPEVISQNRWLALAYEGLGFTSTQQFLFALGMLTLSMLAASNGVHGLNTWLVARFTHGLNHDLSRRLLERYLRQSYSFYLSRNTSRLAKNVLAEVNAVVNGVVQPLVQILARGTLALFILALLFYVDVLLALMVFSILGLLYGGVYVAVRSRQGKLGRQRVEANSERFRAAAEAFGGIKDVKVLAREGHFLRRFSKPSARYARTNASNAIISQIPRQALETVAFGGMLVIVLYLLRVHQDLGQVLPVVSLYAFAAYRLMPAFHEIFGALTKTRFNLAALEDLCGDLVGDRLAPEREAVFPVHNGRPAQLLSPAEVVLQREIRLERVSFRYPGAAELALREVSLTIPRNATVGLVGETGCGKTTLADLLLGLFEPTEGRILVDGLPVTGDRLIAWRRNIGYVAQQIFLADDTIRRNIAFGIPDDEVDPERVLRAARVAHLEELLERLSAGLDTIVGERGIRLSGGQRQRIGIARALYEDPDVLVMDEATSALDNVTEAAVMEAMRGLYRRKTIVLVAHRLSTIETCDRIFVLSRGRLVAEGTYAELMAHSESFRILSRVASPTGKVRR